MSNLKRDIEELVKEKQLAHCCAGMGCETASHIDVQPIINLIESALPEKLPDGSICNCCDECGNSVPWETGYNQCLADIKSKLIGGSNCLQKPYNIHRNRLKTLAFYY